MKFSNCVRNHEKIKVGLSKAVLFLDIHKQDAEKIQLEYGVFCFTPEDKEKIKCLQLKTKFTVHAPQKTDIWKSGEGTCPDGVSEKGWNFYFSQYKGILPCSVLVIIDHYLLDLKPKAKDYATDIWNLKEIISNCINKIEKYNFQILFISGNISVNERDIENFKKRIKKVNEMLKSIAYINRQNIRIEYIYCDGCNGDMDKLYAHTHDRNVFSNFLTVDAPHDLKAFNYYEDGRIKNARETQKIEVLPPFSDGLENSSIYIESDEQTQDAYIEKLVTDFKKGTSTELRGNNRRFYVAYEIPTNGKIKELNVGQNVKLLNRIIMDKIELKEGEPCCYLSVPNKNDWSNIKKKDGIYRSHGEFNDCIVVKKSEAKTLKNYIDKIKDLFKDKKEGGKSHFFKIVVSDSSDIKTLHVIGSNIEDASLHYKGNRFSKESEAMGICNKICQILNFDDVYSLGEIEKIKQYENNEAAYFFKPWKKDGRLDGKKVLIVGASHYCPHSLKNDAPCEYFCDCTNCSVTEGNSKLYNWKCPYREEKDCEDSSDQNKYLLEEETIRVVNEFIADSNCANTSFKEFTNFMQEYFSNIERSDESSFANFFWNNVSFVNYGQNFEFCSIGNHFCNSDFESFKSYLREIKPNVVILWGCSIGDDLKRHGFKPKEGKDITDSYGYYWKGVEGYEDIEFVNCYHPSRGKIELYDGERFSNALNMIWKNNEEKGCD